MQVAQRSYVLASAAMLATGAIVALPLASRPSQIPVVSMPIRLVDDSIANIPINLFDDILNIPYNEVQALGTGAGSLFDTGSWWVPSSTNVWGIDTGDITHVAGIFAFALPFPALTEGVGGVDYQIDGLLAAELPASASCDAATCAPVVPAEVVTGGTSIDKLMGFLDAFTPQSNFGLFENWFQVPLSDLTSGYTFDSTDDPGVVDPSGPTTQGFGFPLDGGANPFEGGTTLDPTTGANDFPWDGLTYTLNPLQPFENFYESLLATPSTTGIDGTGIDLPSLTDIVQNLQSGAAGLIIDFDPYTAGSPLCPASCDIPAGEQIPALVQDIENLDPSNTTIQAWLDGYAAGTVDGPTTSQIDESIALLQTGEYNLTPTELATVDADLAAINPELPALFTNAGILTDPGYLAYTDATASTTTGATTTAVFDPVYGGNDTSLVPQDLLTLLTNGDTNISALSNLGDFLSLTAPGTIVADPGAFSAAADPGAASSADASNDAANLAALLGLSGASTISTDISALLSQLSTELTTALSAELGANLSTELAATLPTDLASTLLSSF